LAQKPKGIEPEGRGHGFEFDYVKPPLAALELRNEGLGFCEPLRQLSLAQAGILPCLDQQGAEAVVLPRVDGTWHADQA
jgi:hypothetical protein